MALTQRKKRPIKRDINSLRDDKLFIIACDDTYAPVQYFNFFRLPRVQIHVVPTINSDSHASHVLRRLKETPYEEEDERWLLLDTDHCIKDSHQREFTNCLRQARQSGIQVALSKPCFELWLLLHHLEANSVLGLNNAKAVEKRLKQVLDGYDKTKLKPADFTATLRDQACLRAAELDRFLDEQYAGRQDIPQANTSRVYLIWRNILKSSPST